MATLVNPIRVTWGEDQSATVMARVYDDTAALMLQAAVSTITYSVFDLSNSNTVTASGSLTVSSVVFDTLQTDARWQGYDTTGYNFRHTLPTTAFPTGNNQYRYEAKITFTSGAIAWVKAEGPAARVYTS